MSSESVIRGGLISLGSLTLPITGITAAYSIDPNDYLIYCVSGSFSVVLPSAANITGKIYEIKNDISGGTITVSTTSGQTIDGLTTKTLGAGDCIHVQSNGVNWVMAGATGTSGTSGTSGASGSSGESGSSGTSGTSGTSGSSGSSGDLYRATSTSYLNISGGTQTLTIYTGLSYIPGQSLVIGYDGFNYMAGVVVSYTFHTGVLVANISSTLGSGNYTSWDVNLGGAPGADGTSGTSGTSGSSGTSGTSGTAGTSGSTGLYHRQITLGTNLITAGDTGVINQSHVGIGYGGVITGWILTCYPSASVTIDVWKVASGVPTLANTITGSAKPNVLTGRYNSSNSLTGWTTTVTAGDYFMMNIDSNTGASYINLQLIIGT